MSCAAFPEVPMRATDLFLTTSASRAVKEKLRGKPTDLEPGRLPGFGLARDHQSNRRLRLQTRARQHHEGKPKRHAAARATPGSIPARLQCDSRNRVASVPHRGCSSMK